MIDRLPRALPFRLRFGLGALLVPAVVAYVGCGAPRDPELERRAMKAAERASEAAPAAESEPPPAPAAEGGGPGAARPPADPARRYTTAEAVEILSRITGSGPLMATFETSAGRFSCELFEKDTPETVTNFVALATGAIPWSPKPGAPVRTAPFYDGLTFHRAIDQFIAQTGNPSGLPSGGPGWRIIRETARAATFDAPGALAMVDDGDDSHGSQLFVTLKRDTSLARRYAAFGQCDDLTVPRAIAAAEKKPAKPGESAAVPLDPVRIARVRIHRGPLAETPPAE